VTREIDDVPDVVRRQVDIVDHVRIFAGQPNLHTRSTVTSRQVRGSVDVYLTDAVFARRVLMVRVEAPDPAMLEERGAFRASAVPNVM
jgi:hypothetical protein